MGNSTITPHYSMKRAPMMDYTIVWAQGLFFYENLYYLLIFSFFLGFNTYKRQRCRLGLKERAGNPRFKRILSPAPPFFFFHLDYTTNLNGYLQTIDTYSHHHHWSIRSGHRSARKQQEQQGLEMAHHEPLVWFLLLLLLFFSFLCPCKS